MFHLSWVIYDHVKWLFTLVNAMLEEHGLFSHLCRGLKREVYVSDSGASQFNFKS